MQNSIIAKNYAKALFEIAQKSDNIDKIQENLNIFNKIFDNGLKKELKNPTISKQNLVEIISKICEKVGVQGVVADFLLVIAKNRRISYFQEVNSVFDKMVKEEKNIIQVEIISASSLGESEISRIKDEISKKNQGKKVEIKSKIQSKILGGVQIKIGSNLIDASLRNQLKSLEEKLVKAIN